MKAQLLALLALVALSANAATCSSYKTRRDYGDLSAAEWKEYVSGLNTLRASGKYDEYVKTYADGINEALAGNNFGFWHRSYLNKLEQELIAANPKVTAVPYWDWSRDYIAPHKAKLWTNDYAGSSKCDGVSSSSAVCIPDGPYSTPKLRDGSCIIRGFNPDNGYSVAYSSKDKAQAPRFPSPAELSYLIAKTDNYADFLAIVKNVVHAIPKAYIGGKAGQCWSDAKAVIDPTYTLHIAYVDYLHQLYQDAHPNQKYDDAPYKSLNSKASDVFSCEQICVKYAPAQGWPKVPECPATSAKPVPTKTTTTTTATTTTAAAPKVTTITKTELRTLPTYITSTSAAVDGTATVIKTITITATTVSTALVTVTSTLPDATTITATSTAATSTTTSSAAQASCTPAGDVYYKPSCPYVAPKDTYYLPQPPADYYSDNKYDTKQADFAYGMYSNYTDAVVADAKSGTTYAPPLPKVYTASDTKGTGNGASSAVSGSLVAVGVAAMAAVLAL